MTNSHPITRLQKFRLLSLIPLYFMIVGLFFTAHHGNSSGTAGHLIKEPVLSLITGLLPGRRHRNFLYQRRTADAFMYLDHLFP